jgi:dolichol-phosphate mannosyltransferase
MKLHSIVLPAFNEEEVLNDTFASLQQLIDSVSGDRFEVIFVNDGSRDRTGEILKTFTSIDPRFKSVHLSRNFGHQIAVTAGVAEAKGDTVSVIDADLQDPPELILAFIEKWSQGYDVVYGIRRKRDGENAFKLLSAALYYRIIQKLSQFPLPVDAGDFRLMDRRVVEAYLRCPEHQRYFRGLIAWVGFKQIGVKYDRKARLKGETKYTLSKMFRFATDGFTSFSIWPLKLASYLGFFSGLLAFLSIAYVIWGKIQGRTISGWASMMVVFLIFTSFQLFCLGILGEYLGRVFDEVRNRPLYFVKDKIGF